VVVLAISITDLICGHTKGYYITNIYKRSLNDTIFNIFSQQNIGVGTKLKNIDTVLIIRGDNDSLKLEYSSYADMGFEAWASPNITILSKKADSDSFYLRKGDHTIGFRLDTVNRR
jgi:hypothetical protein